MAYPIEDHACSAFSADELADLKRAIPLLEENHLIAKITSELGKCIDASKGFLLRGLPGGVSDTINQALETALRAALDTALLSVGNSGTGWSWLDRQLASQWSDFVVAILTGIIGGGFGLPGTLLELPITTTLLMRAVVKIAKEEGEDLESDASKLECLHVFAFGGPSSSDDGAESGYYGARIGLAQALNELAGKALSDALPSTITVVAARFGVPVTSKVAAEAVPIAGAVVGAAINVAFMDHFHDKARGHFVVRRLERAHGSNRVQACYEKNRMEWLADKQGLQKRERGI